MQKPYQPQQKILSNYADVLINFALGSGKGIKSGETIFLQFDLPALPLAQECYKSILEKGGNAILKPEIEKFKEIFYKNSTQKQLEFFPKKYYKALVDSIDHKMYIIAEENPELLEKVPSKKIIQSRKNIKIYRKWLDEKENKGKFTWTLGLYATEGNAKQANLSLKQYWQQIINACFLDNKNPKQVWKDTYSKMDSIKTKLTNMKIDKVHILAKNTDLWIKIGEKRKFVAGSGRNIPSFEIFTSPDWRGTNGKIFFDFPLFRYGKLMKDIYLEFKDGIIIKSKAIKNEKFLKELINQKNANKIGEFSLTDIRFSKITKFMAETLYDENFGGEFGNTHLAIGSAYDDTFNGDPNMLDDKAKTKLGFNVSGEHTDIIATTNRTVEAYTKTGKKIIIYKNGKFTL